MRICGWTWGLFVTLLPAIKEPRSGRAERAGMGSRRKKKKKKKILWRVTSDPADRLVGKPAARFVRSFEVGGCKMLKLRSLHTLCRPTVCCLSAPRPRLSRDLNRSACVWMNNRRPFYYKRWRTWRNIEVIHTRARAPVEKEGGMTVKTRLLTQQ